MNDYGSITIDNKNLLDDLLGLNGNDDDPFGLENTKTYLKPVSSSNAAPASSYLSEKKPASSTYLGVGPPVKGRKFFLESPTFTKGEDDIYRYVHSRISSVDPPTERQKNSLNLSDSLDHRHHDNLKSLNEKRTLNQSNFLRTQIPPTEMRISSNRLLSDLAVASLPKPDYQAPPQNKQCKPLDFFLFIFFSSWCVLFLWFYFFFVVFLFC